jgi:Kef-type K+ transport system membrane component KefB
MEHAFSIILVALAAFILPLIAGRMRLPAVVLEILFGIAVGPSLLGLIHESEVMAYLAELGFLLLMFLSGFEIDFGKLERQGPLQIFAGLGVFLLTLALAYYSAVLLGHGPFVTLILATTSVGLVVPTLRSTNRTSTSLGQAILISALIADLLTLIGATIYAMVVEGGTGWNLLNFPALFLGMAALLLFLKRLAWWYPERVERMFVSDDPEEIGIRASLALMFVFVGLSHLLGVEAILGAFFAGAVFAMVFRHRGQLEQKLKGFSYGFLIPIFFIYVGVRFELQALMRPGVLLGALALIGVAVGLKVLAASLLVLQRFSLREVLAAGTLLSSRLSLVIAVAALGARLNLVDRELESQVILLAVVTATVSPTVFRALAPRLPSYVSSEEMDRVSGGKLEAGLPSRASVR